MMGQVSPFLRSIVGGFSHWCPGCEEIHAIWTSAPAAGHPVWGFDNNLMAPSFTPSVKITGKQKINDKGKWTGEWVRDAQGHAIDHCCHYVLTGGTLHYQNDCTHALRGQNIPLPRLPEHCQDPNNE